MFTEAHGYHQLLYGDQNKVVTYTAGSSPRKPLVQWFGVRSHLQIAYAHMHVQFWPIGGGTSENSGNLLQVHGTANAPDATTANLSWAIWRHSGQIEPCVDR